MIELSDTQAILLSNASQRENGSLLPLPASLKAGGGTTKAMAVLIKHGFAEERETTHAAEARRTDGDHRLGLFLTAAGATAIGVTLLNADEQDSGDGAPAPAPTAATKPLRKTTIVFDLLRREQGATLAELIAVTGWLPHTTRAALTGLRKKGHDITRGKRDGITFYAVAAQ